MTTKEYCNNYSVVLDLQCLRDVDNKMYILKEMSAALIKTGMGIFHHIVKPPFSKRKLSIKTLKKNKTLFAQTWFKLEYCWRHNIQRCNL